MPPCLQGEPSSLKRAPESLVEQQQVQAENHSNRQVSQDVGVPVIDQVAHNILAARQHNERNQSEREGKSQHHLREHEYLQGIESHGNYYDGRNHGDQAPPENAEADI